MVVRRVPFLMIVSGFVRSLCKCLGLLTTVTGLVLCVFFQAVLPVQAANGINRQISYQGKLLDATGTAVANGVYSMKFSLYTAASGGTPIWTAGGTLDTPTGISVTVQSGLFTVMLGDTSVGGGSQNPLDGINWQQDALYLGVTIGTDSEMSPRKRIGAVPQAFNAEQLQGMFASSTASGGQNLFTINQTENNAATGTRTALLVRSRGTSNTNDFLIRGLDDSGSQVFSLNRQGSVTSTGIFAFSGAGTSTLSGALSAVAGVSTTNLFAGGNLTVNGSVALGDSSGDTVSVNGLVNTNLLPLTDGSLNIGSVSARWNQGFFVSASSTYASSTYLYGQRATFVAATSTNLSAQDFSAPINSSSSLSLLTMQSTLQTEGVAVGDRFLATFGTNGFHRFDVSSSTNPISLGTTSVVGGVQDAKFVGRYFFTLQGSNAFVIYDTVSGSFVQVGSLDTTSGGTTVALFVQGHYAFLLLSGSIAVVDISDVTRPRRIGSVSTVGSASTFWIRDNFAFTLESGNLRSYNISNPAAMFYTGSSVSAGNFTLVGNRSYLYSVSGSALFITDARTPTSLAAASSLSSVTGNRVSLLGNYAFVNDGTDTQIVDVGNSVTPRVVASIYGMRLNALVSRGQYVFATTLNDELRVYRLPSVQVVGADIGALEAYTLSVSQDGRVAGALAVNGGLNVGYPGISSYGPLAVSATGTTSTIMGGLTVGTSTVDVAMNSGFVMNGDDLFVGGNIGSATSVYTNGSFIAGAATYYGPDSILAQNGNFTVSGTSALNFVSDSVMNFSPLLGATFDGTLLVDSSSTGNPTFRAKHRGYASSMERSWGAYIDRLLIGDDSNSTGTNNYASIISYDTNLVHGLCIKRNNKSCPELGGTVYSLIADDTISASDSFDLAESYMPEGTVTSTDVLVLGSAPLAVRQSTGIAYDPKIIGIASTRPGFLLGAMSNGVSVALTGRVPTKVSTVNGAIAIGDPLTTSEYPGVAMKATRPGMILGYALEPATATSTIEVFVKTGYWAGSILSNDGRVTRLTDDLVVDARAMASASVPTVDSWGLTFRGSAWDGAQAMQPSFSLLTQVESVTSSSFVIRNASSSVIFGLDQLGSATISGDVSVGGRLYPSGRGTAQRSKYIFLDDTSTSTQYIATNADGWQANDSYDFAERYYSPEKLEMGDVVIASERGRFHVQRSLDEKTMLMGIVSTKPAFVAGKPDKDTYPIALAGRVPTKVSGMNGAIKVGDPLAPSSIPGAVVKATKAGPIVGLALENYDAPNIGKIEVFVNPGWWGGGERETLNVNRESLEEENEAKKTQRGFALIAAGEKKVHVAYTSILSYPNIQVTPRGQVNGGWWTDNYSDIGFDLFLNEEQARDVTFAWTVEGTVQGMRVYRSDGTYAEVNPTTGEAVIQTVASSSVPFVAQEREHSSSQVVTPTQPTSTVSVPEVATSTTTVVEETINESAESSSSSTALSLDVPTLSNTEGEGDTNPAMNVATTTESAS